MIKLLRIAVTCLAAIVGMSSWASAQEREFTVTINQKSVAESYAQARAAGAAYIAPELRLMKAFDENVELVGVTRAGESIYRAPADAMEKMRASRLVERVRRGAEDYQPIKLIVGYRNQTKEAVREQLREAGMEIVEDNERATFFIVRAADKERGIGFKAVRTLEQSKATSATPDYEVGIPPKPQAQQKGRGNRDDANNAQTRTRKSTPANKRLAQNRHGQITAVPDDYDPQTLWGMQRIAAPNAWDTNTKSSVIIAVIDSGVDYNHEDLADNMWEDENGKHGYNFVNDNDDPMDDNAHGTHCAGTIAAVGDNGVGVVGVNWEAKIMALKFLNAQGSGSLSNAIKCIDYAIQHDAKVLNNSWGGGGFSPELKEAIERAENAGAIFVAAASNEGTDNDQIDRYPASYDNENIISVLAIDDAGELAWFSCFGANSVDIGAPGVDIASTVPDNDYEKFNGTSMATPHVAGACALAWSHPQHQGKGWSEIKQLIMDNGVSNSKLQGKCQTESELNIGFLESSPPSGTPQPLVIAESARFAWHEGKEANGSTTLLSVEIDLPQEMEVHIQASSSVTAENNTMRLTTGLSNSSNFDEYWDQSLRFVDITSSGTWINFSTSHSETLSAGRHVIHWNIWPDGNETAIFDSGVLLVQAFGESNVSSAPEAESSTASINDRIRIGSAQSRSAKRLNHLDRSSGTLERFPRVNRSKTP
ncbi:MAG: S8 family peptidase [Novipirellula sp. JB048]